MQGLPHRVGAFIAGGGAFLVDLHRIRFRRHHVYRGCAFRDHHGCLGGCGGIGLRGCGFGSLGGFGSLSGLRSLGSFRSLGHHRGIGLIGVSDIRGLLLTALYQDTHQTDHQDQRQHANANGQAAGIAVPIVPHAHIPTGGIIPAVVAGRTGCGCIRQFTIVIAHRTSSSHLTFILPYSPRNVNSPQDKI